jgi:hypothetical protein
MPNNGTRLQVVFIVNSKFDLCVKHVYESQQSISFLQVLSNESSKEL